MRQGVVEAAVNDLWRRLRRWDSIVRVDSLWGIKFSVLNALHYAVNALVSILLRRSVLLMLLQIGTAAHIRAEAWAASFSWCINLGHGDLISRLWRDVQRSLSSSLRLVMEGLALQQGSCAGSIRLLSQGWIDRG
jgi:hypothetical protein